MPPNGSSYLSHCHYPESRSMRFELPLRRSTSFKPRSTGLLALTHLRKPRVCHVAKRSNSSWVNSGPELLFVLNPSGSGQCSVCVLLLEVWIRSSPTDKQQVFKSCANFNSEQNSSPLLSVAVFPVESSSMSSWVLPVFSCSRQNMCNFPGESSSSGWRDWPQTASFFGWTSS